MKIKVSSFFFALFFLCILGTQSLNAQVIDKTSITAQEANFELIAPNSYLMEIGGPNGYYYKEEIKHANNISISNVNTDGNKFEDGSYLLQVTPIVTLTEKERKELNALREKNDLKEIAAYRLAHKLPEQVDVTNVYFSIRNGQFVTPEQKEIKGLSKPRMSIANQDHPSLYASLNYVATSYEKSIVGSGSLSHTTDNTTMQEDQVFLDDVIIDGSICVGQDCVNGENFGFDTGRYKENNLRVHFDDTSSSASFPSNDWRISINDSSNGGSNYFAVEDATAGTTPFRVMAGAGSNALYISNSGGNVGMGTASPVVELHVTDGDSPTLRLEQNGSSGFGSQTWDIAGNETNFFVRDVTNGSKLPFKIKPGAPDNSVYIDAEGDLGLGTANPGSNALQVESGDVYVKAGNLGINTSPTSALDVVGNFKLKGTSVFTGDMTTFLATGSTYFTSSFQTVLKLDATNKRVGIGTPAPGHLLELSDDDAVKPNGGSWTAPSDRRLKTDIVDFHDGLNKILQIRPVKFKYNGKLGYPTDVEYIGVIAQEMKEVAPYTVKDLNHNREGKGYLAFDPSSLTYLLVNAVQEQQEMIDTQQKEIDKLQNKLMKFSELEAQLETLTEMVSSLKEAEKSSGSSDEAIGEKK